MSKPTPQPEQRRCPFCDAAMQIVGNRLACPGGGRLLVDGNQCPLVNQLLTPVDALRLDVALIDLEME